MRYRSKRGTIITIPDGLTAKQIAAIKADADAGYGTRAQATADRLGKALATKTPATPVDETSLKGAVNPNGGEINPVKAAEIIDAREEEDITTNFNLEHPQVITDQYGNKRTIIRHADGTVTVTDEAGGTAKRFKDLAEAAASTFNGDVSRKAAYDAEFGQRTAYLARNQQREEEAAKQELANRGIPYNPDAAYDPNTQNVYGRTLGSIKQNYQSQWADAADRATLAGNQAFATDASARDSFLNALATGASTFGGNFGQYENSVSTDSSGDAKDLVQLSSAAFLSKYGIDKDTYIKNKALNKSGSGAPKESAGFEIVG